MCTRRKCHPSYSEKQCHFIVETHWPSLYIYASSAFLQANKGYRFMRNIGILTVYTVIRLQIYDAITNLFFIHHHSFFALLSKKPKDDARNFLQIQGHIFVPNFTSQ